MPTAEDYWRAAEDFSARAQALAAVGPPVATSLGDDVVCGGRLRSVLEEAIEAVVRGVGVTAAGFDALAAECRRRAIACQDYSAALAAHRRSVEAYEATAPESRAGLIVVPAPRREPWMPSS